MFNFEKIPVLEKEIAEIKEQNKALLKKIDRLLALWDDEEWRPVSIKPFDEKYLVSNLGRVKTKDNSLFPKTGTYGKGQVVYVNLYHRGKSTKARVDVLVADAFLERTGEEKNPTHKDGDNLNCKAVNLEW